jgi:hypothetical protein
MHPASNGGDAGAAEKQVVHFCVQQKETETVTIFRLQGMVTGSKGCVNI